MGDLESFSDCLTINILSRLPADCVVKCRRVCKRWKHLTSTSYFIDLQLKMQPPALVFLNRWPFKGVTFYTARQETTKMEMEPFCTDLARYLLHDHDDEDDRDSRYLTHSCDGLLVLQRSTDYLICNPVTCQEMTIPLLKQGKDKSSFLCGFFFHILTKEYMLLRCFEERDFYGYEMLSLSNKSWRKLTGFTHFCPCYRTPVIVNECLHWMLKHRIHVRYHCHKEKKIFPCAQAILRFNMITEDFDTIPHPIYKSCDFGCSYYCDDPTLVMQILDFQGLLSLVAITKQGINIWVLDDPTNCYWVQRCRLSFSNFERFGYKNYFDNLCMDPIGIQNGELILNWYHTGLFVCSLVGGDVRVFETIDQDYWKKTVSMFLSYKETLVTLPIN